MNIEIISVLLLLTFALLNFFEFSLKNTDDFSVLEIAIVLQSFNT